MDSVSTIANCQRQYPEISHLKCAVCGRSATGWNANGPFCADASHYQVSQDLVSKYAEMHAASLQRRGVCEV